MKISNKTVLGIVAATGLGLASAAALSAPWGGHGDGDCGGRGHHRGHHSAEERAEHMQERMEALKSKLGIRAEQEAAWDAFTAAQQAQMAAMAENHKVRKGQREESADVSLPERLDNRTAFMEARMAGMKLVAQTMKDLYAVLDDEQKAIADEFMEHRGRRGRWH